MNVSSPEEGVPIGCLYQLLMGTPTAPGDLSMGPLTSHVQSQLDSVHSRSQVCCCSRCCCCCCCYTVEPR